MERFAKIVRQISIKNIAVHIVGIAFAGAIIWGVSYLLLVTFSIQESAKNAPVNTEVSGKVTASTTNKNPTGTTTTKLPSTKK
jgi:uncharacterized membrane protein